jgi:hypothetical protein
MTDGLGVIVLMNGPGGRSDEEIAGFALKLLRAANHDQKLPSITPAGATSVENAAEYAGTFMACPAIRPSHQPCDRTPGTGMLVLESEGDRLVLHTVDKPIALEPRGLDRFYVDHPDLVLFLLRFGRQNGKVVEAFHGPEWYPNDRYTGPTTFDHPQQWDAYPGHYRSHNPELTDFRIVLRKGVLALIHASGDEEPMVSLGGAVFRLGKDDRSPERIRFDTIVDGRALRAILSCGNYYRTA